MNFIVLYFVLIMFSIFCSIIVSKNKRNRNSIFFIDDETFYLIQLTRPELCWKVRSFLVFFWVLHDLLRFLPCIADMRIRSVPLITQSPCGTTSGQNSRDDGWGFDTDC